MKRQLAICLTVMVQIGAADLLHNSIHGVWPWWNKQEIAERVIGTSTSKTVPPEVNIFKEMKFDMKYELRNAELTCLSKSQQIGTYTCEDSDVITQTKLARVQDAVSVAIKRLSPMLSALKISGSEETLEIAKVSCKDSFSFTDPRLSSAGGLTTDMLLFVTASPVTPEFFEFVSNVTIVHDLSLNPIMALGYPCYFAAGTHRPVVGHLNINPKFINEEYDPQNYLTDVITHELIHILGFTASLAAPSDTTETYYIEWGHGYSSFSRRQSSQMQSRVQRPTQAGSPVFFPEITNTNTTANVALQTTPAVIEAAKKHFNCPLFGTQSLPGLELEDYMFQNENLTRLGQTVHWEKRILRGEIMNSVVEKKSKVTSITLAMLEDSGYYRVNKDAAEVLKYGKGAGCSFVQKSCMEWHKETSTSKYSCYEERLFTCERLGDTGCGKRCTPDLTSLATCSGYLDSKPMPDQYLHVSSYSGERSFFTSREKALYHYGNDPLMDYCMVWENTAATDDCTTFTNMNGAGQDCLTGTCSPFSISSPSSACFLGNVHLYNVGRPRTSGHCLPYSCVSDNSGLYWNVLISVGLKRVTCTPDTVGKLLGPLDMSSAEAFSQQYRTAAGALSGGVYCPDPSSTCADITPPVQPIMRLVDANPLVRKSGDEFKIEISVLNSNTNEPYEHQSPIVMCVTSGEVDDLTVRSGLFIHHSSFSCTGKTIGAPLQTLDECTDVCKQNKDCVACSPVNTVVPCAYQPMLSCDTMVSIPQLTCTLAVLSKNLPPSPKEVTCKKSYGSHAVNGTASFYVTHTHAAAPALQLLFWSPNAKNTLLQEVHIISGNVSRLKFVGRPERQEVLNGELFSVTAQVVDGFGNAVRLPQSAMTECPWDEGQESNTYRTLLEGKCLEHYLNPTSRTLASDKCLAEGGTLLTVDSEAVEKLVTSRSQGKPFWSGLTVVDTTTNPPVVMWDSSASASYFNKKYNSDPVNRCCKGLHDPDPSNFGECMAYPFEAVSCEMLMQFWCEYPATSIATLFSSEEATLEVPDLYVQNEVRVTSDGIANFAGIALHYDRSDQCGSSSGGSVELSIKHMSTNLVTPPLDISFKSSAPHQLLMCSAGVTSGKVTAGSTIEITVNSADLGGGFVAWGEHIDISINNIPTRHTSDSDDMRRAVPQQVSSCRSGSPNSCKVSITVPEKIPEGGQLILRAFSPPLQSSELYLTVVAGEAMMLQTTTPSYVVIGSSVGRIEVQVTDQYGNPVCESGIPIVSSQTTGYSLQTLEGAGNYDMCRRHILQDDCTKAGCVFSTQTARDLGLCQCLKIPSLPAGCCCGSINGPEMIPLEPIEDLKINEPLPICFDRENSIHIASVSNRGNPGSICFSGHTGVAAEWNEFDLDNWFVITAANSGKTEIEVLGDHRFVSPEFSLEVIGPFSSKPMTVQSILTPSGSQTVLCGRGTTPSVSINARRGERYVVRVTGLGTSEDWPSVFFTLRQKIVVDGTRPILNSVAMPFDCVDRDVKTQTTTCGKAAFDGLIIQPTNLEIQSDYCAFQDLSLTFVGADESNKLSPGRGELSTACVTFDIHILTRHGQNSGSGEDVILWGTPILPFYREVLLTTVSLNGATAPTSLSAKLVIKELCTTRQDIVDVIDITLTATGTALNYPKGYQGSCLLLKFELSAKGILTTSKNVVVAPNRPDAVKFPSQPELIEAGTQLPLSAVLYSGTNPTAAETGTCKFTASVISDLDDASLTWEPISFYEQQSITVDIVQGKAFLEATIQQAGYVRITATCSLTNCPVGDTTCSMKFIKTTEPITVVAGNPLKFSCNLGGVDKVSPMDTLYIHASVVDKYGNAATALATEVSLSTRSGTLGNIKGKTRATVGSTGLVTWRDVAYTHTGNLELVIKKTRNNDDVTPYQYVGCYKDPPKCVGCSEEHQHTFTTSETYAVRILDLSPASCHKICTARGMPVFALSSTIDDMSSTTCVCAASLVSQHGSVRRNYCANPCRQTSCGVQKTSTSCKVSSQCVFNNMICSNEVCTCMSGYVFNSKSNRCDSCPTSPDTHCGVTNDGGARYVSVYKTVATPISQLGSIVCPTITVVAGAPYRLTVISQPCQPGQESYISPCRNSAHTDSDCLTAVAGQQMMYTFGVLDKGGNSADITRRFVSKKSLTPTEIECPSQFKKEQICGLRGGVMQCDLVDVEVGCLQNDISQSSKLVELQVIHGSSSRLVHTGALPSYADNSRVEFSFSYRNTDCLSVRAVSAGLVSSGVTRKICFSPSTVSSLTVQSPAVSGSDSTMSPVVVTAFDKFGNVAKWVQSKIKIESCSSLSCDNVLGTLSGTSSKPMVGGTLSETQLIYTSYDASQTGFYMRATLPRSESSIFGCTGSNASKIAHKLDLLQVDLEPISAYSPLIILRRRSVEKVTAPISAIAGTSFSISVRVSDSPDCKSVNGGLPSTLCTPYQGYNYIMKVIQSPFRSVCKECKGYSYDLENGFNTISIERSMAGLYVFSIGLVGTTEVAPLEISIVVLAGEPSRLKFIDSDCLSLPFTITAGVAFSRTVQILDRYENPTSGWTRPIILKACPVTSASKCLSVWEHNPPSVVPSKSATEVTLNGLNLTTVVTEGILFVAQSSGIKSTPVILPTTIQDNDYAKTDSLDFRIQDLSADSSPRSLDIQTGTIILAQGQCGAVFMLSGEAASIVPEIVGSVFNQDIVRAGVPFGVFVRVLDSYGNLAENSVDGFTARLTLTEGTSMLRGSLTSIVARGVTSFSGLSYGKAPEEISISVTLLGVDMPSTSTKAVLILPGTGTSLRIVKPSIAVGIPPSTEEGSLQAGDRFCVDVEIIDTEGNVITPEHPRNDEFRETTTSYDTQTSKRGSYNKNRPLQDAYDVEWFDIITQQEDHFSTSVPPSVAALFRNALVASGTLSQSVSTQSTGRSLERPLRVAADKSTSISLGISWRSEKCDFGICNTLMGTTSQKATTGKASFCGLSYESAECIDIAAYAEGLIDGVSPTVCFKSATPKTLKCESAEASGPVGVHKPFPIINTFLYDNHGNQVLSCPSCKVTATAVRDGEDDDLGGYLGGETSKSIGPNALTTFSDLSFSSVTAGRPIGIKFRIESSSILLETICSETYEVTNLAVACSVAEEQESGEQFNVTSTIVKYNPTTEKYMPACPDSSNADCRGYTATISLVSGRPTHPSLNTFWIASVPPQVQGTATDALNSNGEITFPTTITIAGKVGLGIVARTSSGGVITGTCSDVSVAPTVASKLNVVCPPSVVDAGTPFSFVTYLTDNSNNVVTSVKDEFISCTLSNEVDPPQTIREPFTLDSTGKAVFPLTQDLLQVKSGMYNLNCAIRNIKSSSCDINVRALVPDKVTCKPEKLVLKAGEEFSVVGALVDKYGNPTSHSAMAAKLTLATGSQQLTSNANVAEGIVSFPHLQYHHSEVIIIHLSVEGFAIPAVCHSINVIQGEFAGLHFENQPTCGSDTTVRAGEIIKTAITLVATDRFGNVASDRNDIFIILTPARYQPVATGFITGNNQLRTRDGRVSFTAIQYNVAEQIRVVAGAIHNGVGVRERSELICVSAGAAASLKIVSQPTTCSIGLPIRAPIWATVQDSNKNNVISDSGCSVAISLTRENTENNLLWEVQSCESFTNDTACQAADCRWTTTAISSLCVRGESRRRPDLLFGYSSMRDYGVFEPGEVAEYILNGRSVQVKITVRNNEESYNVRVDSESSDRENVNVKSLRKLSIILFGGSKRGPGEGEAAWSAPASSATNNFWRYNLITQRWQELIDIQSPDCYTCFESADNARTEWTDCTAYCVSPRFGQASSGFEGKMFIFGGMDRNGKFLGDLHVVDIEKFRFNEYTSTVTPTYTETLTGSNIVTPTAVSETVSLTQRTPTLESQTETFSYTRSIEVPENEEKQQPRLVFATAAIYRSTLFVYGGVNEDGISNQLWTLDISQLTFGRDPNPMKTSWKVLPSATMPDPMYGMASVLRNGMLYVFPGITETGTPGKVWTRDLTGSEDWKSDIETENIPAASAVSYDDINDRVVLFGGTTNGGWNPSSMSSTVSILDLQSNSWISEQQYPVGIQFDSNAYSSIPGGRSFMSTAPLISSLGKSYYFGGFSAGQDMSNGWSGSQATTVKDMFGLIITTAARATSSAIIGSDVDLPVTGSALQQLHGVALSGPTRGAIEGLAFRISDFSIVANANVALLRPLLTAALTCPEKPDITVQLEQFECLRCEIEVTLSSNIRAVLTNEQFPGTNKAHVYKDMHTVGNVTVVLTNKGVALTVDQINLLINFDLEFRISRSVPSVSQLAVVTKRPTRITLPDGSQTLGTTFGLAETGLSVQLAPSTIWVKVTHSAIGNPDACSDSREIPINIVPDRPCKWAVSEQPSRVVAGNPFGIVVTLYDTQNNIAFCGVQYSSMRIPSYLARRLIQQPADSWKLCEQQCNTNSECMMWNYEQNSGLCFLYDTAGDVELVSKTGWVSGIHGAIPCSMADIGLQSAAISYASELSGSPVGQTLTHFNNQLSSRGCFTVSEQLLSSYDTVHTDIKSCQTCCGSSGSQFMMVSDTSEQTMCTCLSSIDDEIFSRRSPTCSGEDTTIGNINIEIFSISRQITRPVDGHQISFSGLWHNTAELLELEIFYAARPSCGTQASLPILIVAGNPHHINAVSVPDNVPAPSCAFIGNAPVSFEVVDFWNNKNDVSDHRITLSLGYGTGTLGGRLTKNTESGTVIFDITYDKAETIELIVTDLNLIHEACSENQIGCTHTALTPDSHRHMPDCKKRCVQNSCQTPTPPVPVFHTDAIRFLTGPPARLGVVMQPPQAVNSSDSFTIAVELQDKCGNKVSSDGSGLYSQSACINTRLQVFSMDTTKTHVTNTSLVNGYATAQISISTAKVTHFLIQAESSATCNVKSVETDDITIKPGKACCIKIVRPEVCTLKLPRPTISIAREVPTFVLHVIDEDGNLVSDEDLKISLIGCYMSTSSGFMSYDVPTIPSELTIEHCAEKCDAEGYQLMAIENGIRCKCGNRPILPNSEATSAECSVTCSGAVAHDMRGCGGWERLQVFNIDSGYSISMSVDQGQMVGASTVGTIDGIAELSPVWIPSSYQLYEQCLVDATLPGCSDLSILATLSISEQQLHPSTCALSVQANIVKCTGPDSVVVGQQFDISIDIYKPDGVTLVDTSTTISLVDTTQDPDRNINELTDIIGAVPSSITTSTGMANFKGLRFETILPKGADSVLRSIYVQATASSQCSLSIIVKAGRPAACSVVEPAQAAYAAGEQFSFTVMVLDSVGNNAVDDARCIEAPFSLVGCTPATPRNFDENIIISEALLSSADTYVFIHVSVASIRGIDTFVNADGEPISTLYPSFAGWGPTFEPTPADIASVKSGNKCVIINYGENFNWVLADCNQPEKTRRYLCKTTTPCSAQGIWTPGVFATVTDTTNETTTEYLSGQIIRHAIGSAIAFPGLSYTKAERSVQLNYAVRNSSRDIICEGSFTRSFPPNKPSRLTISPWIQRPVSINTTHGVTVDGVCLDCSPEISVSVQAFDEYDNLCSWSHPVLGWIPEEIVGEVDLRLKSGAGELRTEQSQGLSSRLSSGKITFSGLSFTAVGDIVLEAIAPKWQIAVPVDPYPPTSSIVVLSCIVRVVSVILPSKTIAGQTFTVTVRLADEFGNTLNHFSRLTTNFAVSLTPTNANDYSAVPMSTEISGSMVFSVTAKVASVALQLLPTLTGGHTTCTNSVVINAGFINVLHGEPATVSLVDSNIAIETVTVNRPVIFGIKAQVSDKHGNPILDTKRYPMRCEMIPIASTPSGTFIPITNSADPVTGEWITTPNRERFLLDLHKTIDPVTMNPISYSPSFVWFRFNFGVSSVGSHKVHISCTRTDSSVGTDSLNAESMIFMMDTTTTPPTRREITINGVSTGKKLMIVKEALEEDACPVRIATPLTFRIRGLSPQEGTLPSTDTQGVVVSVNYGLKSSTATTPATCTIDSTAAMALGQADAFCTITTPATSDTIESIVFEAPAFAAAVSALTPIRVIGGCVNQALFTTSLPAEVKVRKSFFLSIQIVDIAGNVGGDDVVVELEAFVFGTLLRLTDDAATVRVVGTKLSSPLLETSITSEIKAPTEDGKYTFIDLEINHPIKIDFKVSIKEFRSRCDSSCQAPADPTDQIVGILFIPSDADHCVVVGYPNEQIAGLNPATYRIQIRDQYGHGVHEWPQGKPVTLQIAEGRSNLNVDVGNKLKLSGISPAAIPSDSLHGCPISTLTPPATMCLTGLGPRASLPRSVHNAFSLELWARFHSMIPSSTPSILMANSQLSWFVEWRRHAVTRHGSHWMVLEVPPGHKVAEIEMISQLADSWHNYVATFEGITGGLVSGEGAAEIFVDAINRNTFTPATWTDLTDPPTVSPFLEFRPSSVLLYDIRVFSLRLTTATVGRHPPGAVDGVESTHLQLRVTTTGLTTEIIGSLVIEPQGATMAPLSNLELTRDTPEATDFGALTIPYGLPANCVHTADSPCVFTGLTHGATLSNIWYSLAPEVITVTCEVFGLSSIPSAAIVVRPGWPHRMGCAEIATQATEGSNWVASVSLLDEAGNLVDCNGGFPRTFNAYPSQIAAIGASNEQIWRCQNGHYAEIKIKGSSFDHFLPSKTAEFGRVKDNDGKSLAIARFHVKYSEAPVSILLNGGGEQIRALIARLNQKASLFLFGIDTAASKSDEGWDLTDNGRDNQASYTGTWFAGTQLDGLLYREHNIAAIEGEVYFYAQVTTTSGSQLKHFAQMRYVTSRDTSESRIIPLASYTLTGRITHVAKADGLPTEDVGIISLEYRSINNEPLFSLTGRVIGGKPEYPTWGIVSVPHIAPPGAHYIVINLRCTKNDPFLTSSSGVDCLVAFDDIGLSPVRKHTVFTEYTTSVRRADGSSIPALTCGPTLIVPPPMICQNGELALCSDGSKPCDSCDQLCATGQPSCEISLNCDSSTCNHNGVCAALSPSDARYIALRRNWPEICLLEAYSACCGNDVRDDAPLAFFEECGKAFCERVPSPCKCNADYRNGFWAGPNCETCALGYEGSKCNKVPCPTGANGVECSGHGVCRADGKCVCFGQDQGADALTTPLRPSMFFDGSYFVRATGATSHSDGKLKYPTTGSQASDTPNAEYASCQHILQIHKARMYGKPDDGLYFIAPACTHFSCPDGPSTYCSCTTFSGKDSYPRFCRFFNDAATNSFIGAEMIGGAWSATRPLSSVVLKTSELAGDTTQGEFRPLERSITEDIFGPLGPTVGSYWSQLTDSDGNYEGGAFWHSPLATNTVSGGITTIELTIFSTDRNQFIAVEELLLLAAIREANTVKNKGVIVPAVYGRSASLKTDSLCVYSTNGIVGGNFIGIFSECDTTKPRQSWPMWFGEGGWVVSEDGRGGHRISPESVRVFSANRPITPETDFTSWEDTTHITETLNIKALVPDTISYRISDCCTGNSTWSDYRPKTWRTINGGTFRAVAYGEGATVTATFGNNHQPEGEHGDIEKIQLMVSARVNSGIDLKVQVVLPDERFSDRKAGTSLTQLTSFTAFYTPPGGSDLERSVESLFDLSVTLEELRGLKIISTYSTPLPPSEGDITIEAIMLLVHYRKVPPLQTLSFDAKIKCTEISTPMTVFRAGDPDGSSITIDLNVGREGKLTKGAVSVRLEGSSGEVLRAVAPGMGDLFTSKWILFSVKINTFTRSIQIGTTDVIGEQVIFQPRDSSISETEQGDPKLRSLLFMKEGITIGANIASGFPSRLYNGFLREVSVKIGSLEVLNLPMEVSPGTANSITTAYFTSILLQRTAGWKISTVATDPFTEPWQQYETNAQPDVATLNHFLSATQGGTSTVDPVQLPTQRGIWAGDVCNTCGTNYFGGDCRSLKCKDDGECNTATCPNSQCDAPPSGRCETNSSLPLYGRCICSKGYTGAICDRCEPAPVKWLYTDIYAEGGSTLSRTILVCSDKLTCPTTCAEGGRWVANEYFDVLVCL